MQLQAQEQALIAAENTREKYLILLKREIGVAPGQKIVLTDAAPYGAPPPRPRQRSCDW